MPFVVSCVCFFLILRNSGFVSTANKIDDLALSSEFRPVPVHVSPTKADKVGLDMLHRKVEPTAEDGDEAQNAAFVEGEEVSFHPKQWNLFLPLLFDGLFVPILQNEAFFFLWFCLDLVAFLMFVATHPTKVQSSSAISVSCSLCHCCLFPHPLDHYSC